MVEAMKREDWIKHLEFIQNVITRLNSNSFQIKSWSITIVTAILALFATTQNTDFILIGIFPTVIFWLMDAYCLTKERKDYVKYFVNCQIVYLS